jgi:hypothetical protein
VFDDGPNIFGSIQDTHDRLVRVRIRIGRINAETVGDSLSFWFLIGIIDGERKDWWLLGGMFLSRDVAKLHGESIVVKLKRFVV